MEVSEYVRDNREVNKTRDANTYKQLSDIQHIYQIPDMYVGSTEPEARSEILLNLETFKLVPSTVTIARAIERVFLEILSNAGDNADNSRRNSVDPGNIDVSMDRQWVKIRNGGLPVPVVESSTPGKLVPDIVFGMLRSSSNYDPNVIRMGCGRNGFGAKLTNIFSKTFIVTVGDNINHRLYTGTWTENMSQGPSPVIQEYSGVEGFVEVCWNLDFDRFGITEYPDEVFNLFARYVADFSLTCKVPVSFNGVEMDYRNIRDYAAIYWTPEDCEKAILHYEWPGFNKENPNGMCPLGSSLDFTKKEKMVAAANMAEHIPIVEMLILDTPDEGMCLSYVNGLLTIDGGVHVNQAFNAVAVQILEIINSTNEKKKKSKDASEIKAPKLTADDIKKHISIIINCRLPDPKYTSQSKTQISSPRPHILIPEKVSKSMGQWNLIARLYAALEAKMFNTLKKSNGSRTKHLFLEAGEDANVAGTDESNKCILYLVEGKSASSYPKKRISEMDGGKNFGGYYPLRGKFMNVRNADFLKVAENKEVKAIKSMMGLREGVDYSVMENLLTLRYGYIMICVDADSDGFHIASLLINYINQFYPGLLLQGRIGILRTPVVRVFKGKTIMHRFYSNEDFESWEKKTENKKGLKIAYYKGLATSSDADIVDDLKTAPVVTVVYDDKAKESLDIAFDKTMANKRKEWISKWREVSHVDDIMFQSADIYKQQKITDFINTELIDYTKDALFRAIPSQDDGLKQSHRQALYAALKYFRYGSKSDDINVARFAAFAANETNYHHGETSMCQTVTKMAQKFVGSNNLPWFEGISQFGTRNQNGEDAGSPRYIKFVLPNYIKLLYDEELINCVPKRIVEGDEVEPIYLPATIPMHLVNGVIGIATGYSSVIPNHNYYDIINWCKARCTIGVINHTTILKPWYRGFKGEISFANITDSDEKVTIDKSDKTEEEIEMLEAEEEARKPRGISITTRGIYKMGANKEKANLIITEIPIGKSILEYRRWLETLVKDKIIHDFDDNSTPDEPNFSIKGYVLKDNPVNYKSLCLEKSIGMGNFTLIDIDGYPTKFPNTNQILEVYSLRMLDCYTRVRETRLHHIREKVEDLGHRIRFITLVVEGKIVINKQSESVILANMASQVPPIPEKYFDSVKLRECTLEKIQNSNEEITKLQKLYEDTVKLLPEQMWLEKLENLEEYLKKNKW